MKRTKKGIEQFFKTYFYFNKHERKGIIALLFILLAVVVLPKVYSAFYRQPAIGFQIRDLTLSPVDSFISKEGANGSSRFKFDPNTASDADLLQLGFSEKHIQTINHFKQSGGRFTKADDLDKIYGVHKALLEALKPFVVIGASQSLHPADTFSKKVKLNYPIELNAADSQTLVALYRIGPALAHRIIEYRNQLGGYLTLEQLKEIWGFDEDILYDLKDKIYVEAKLARLLNLNSVGVDELRSHPYFKYKLSNAIINYRTQHGNYQSLQDLRKIVIVNDSIFNRITMYLFIAP